MDFIITENANLVEVATLVPGNISKRFRCNSAAEVCRVVGGDLTKFLGEVQQNDKKRKSMEGGSFMNFITDNVDNVTIRVDTATKKGSVLDVVRMVLQCNSSVANTYFGKLKEEIPEFRVRCSEHRINGKGRLTPVADAKTLVEVAMLLPGKISRRFRWNSAAVVCRVVGGDLKLLEEVQRNDKKWKSMEGGSLIQEALLQKTEYHEEHKSPKASEKFVRNNLALVVGGNIEVETPVGFIDVLSGTEVIEIKYYRQWKHGLGQVLAYHSYYPRLAKRLHLFAHTGDVDTCKILALAKPVCEVHAVEVTFEVVKNP